MIFAHPIHLRVLNVHALLAALIVWCVLALGECCGYEGDVVGFSCRPFLDQVEQTMRMPAKLLHAIADVESGRSMSAKELRPKKTQQRTVPRRRVAWPWAIHAEGKGHYLASKDAAIRKVKELQQRGIRNIDVGCMQINLHHHPEAFSSLEEAFDPDKNIRYAARFLQGLKSTHQSWTAAIAHYHSATAALHKPYQARVMRAWQTLERQDEEVPRIRPAKAHMQPRPSAAQVNRWAQASSWQQPASRLTDAPAELRPWRTGSLYQRVSKMQRPTSVAKVVTVKAGARDSISADPQMAGQQRVRNIKFYPLHSSR